MKSNNILFALCFAVVAVMAVPASAAVTKIKMKSISYEPKQATIKIGDEVQWENTSYTEHSATADDGKTFDTTRVEPDKTSKSLKFDKAGIYPYHCSLHGKSMSGVINVKE